MIKFLKDYKYSLNGYTIIESKQGDYVQLDEKRESRFISKKVAELVIEKPKPLQYENKMEEHETKEEKAEQYPADNKPRRGKRK